MIFISNLENKGFCWTNIAHSKANSRFCLCFRCLKLGVFTFYVTHQFVLPVFKPGWEAQKG